MQIKTSGLFLGVATLVAIAVAAPAAVAQNRVQSQGYYQPRVASSPPPAHSRSDTVFSAKQAGGAAGLTAGYYAGARVGLPSLGARGGTMVGKTVTGYAAGKVWDQRSANMTQTYRSAPASGVSNTTPYMTRSGPRR